MLLSLLAVSLSLFSSANAGEHLVDFKFQGNFCSIAEESAFPNSTAPQTLEDHGNHIHISIPWTREPKCITDEDIKETFCVYTSGRFANGRGISFFTTPSIAKRVEELPAFKEQGIYEKANVFDDPPWEIRNIAGRGNGLFATRTLHRGDEIIVDTPVGVFQSDAFFADYGIGYKYLHIAFDQLPKKTRDIFMRTAVHSQGDPLMERINTNAFAGDFEGAPHFLMYPETALMNHDCRPNAMYYHDPATLIHATYASRTILPGEEITITYINILQPRSERQRVLKAVWGFDCTCSLCSSNATENQKSEARVQQILDLQTKLADWSPASQGTPAMAEELLSLYKQEHVHAAIGTGHMFAALAYNAAGDVSRAKKHARLAIEAGMVNSGSKEADVDEMNALRVDPKKHWSYMVRRSRFGR